MQCVRVLEMDGDSTGLYDRSRLPVGSEQEPTLHTKILETIRSLSSDTTKTVVFRLTLTTRQTGERVHRLLGELAGSAALQLIGLSMKVDGQKE